jgi:hypothetical protein
MHRDRVPVKQTVDMWMPTKTRYVITMKTEQLWLVAAMGMAAGPAMAREKARAGVVIMVPAPAEEGPEVYRMRKVTGQVKPDSYVFVIVQNFN